MSKHIWLCSALALLAACAPTQQSPVSDQRNKTLLELLNDPSQVGVTFFEEVRAS